MEEKDRKHIINNINKLIRLTKYDELMDKCVEYRLLTPVMRTNIEHDVICEEQSSEDQWHKKLFLKITKRGPQAFQNLKDLLSELKREEALAILNGDDDFRSIQKSSKRTINKKVVAIDEYQENLENDKENEERKLFQEVVKSSNIKKDSKVGTYPMRSEHNRGVFLMVNIIDFLKSKDRRNGADEDGQALIHVFKELGFKHFPFENLTKNEFISNLDIVLKSEYVHHTECFVMALMTHGNLDSTKSECVEFHDGDIMKVSEILERFSHYNCPNLVDKPKVFIFPFCRGDDTEYGRYRTVQTDSIGHISSNGLTETLPIISDVLICYASMRGYRSHRDIDRGNWYIQKFCELMIQHAHDTDLERIVKMVQEEVGKLRTHNGAMQTCCSENISFNKSLFFNPGVWE